MAFSLIHPGLQLQTPYLDSAAAAATASEPSIAREAIRRYALASLRSGKPLGRDQLGEAIETGIQAIREYRRKAGFQLISKTFN